MVFPTMLTRAHFEQALTPEQLRVTALIRIALMLGVSFFYLAIFFLFSLRTPASPGRPDTAFMDILSLAHAVFFLGAMTAAVILPRLALRKERFPLQAEAQTPEQAASIAVGLHRVSTLLFMAPLEGAAFFGAAVCMICVQNGTMDVDPAYWLNAGSAAALIIAGLATFPTRERVLAAMESAFVQS
jgi:hypothetical protein